MRHFKVDAMVGGWVLTILDGHSQGFELPSDKRHVFTEAVELASFIEANAETIEDENKFTYDKLTDIQKMLGDNMMKSSDKVMMDACIFGVGVTSDKILPDGSSTIWPSEYIYRSEPKPYEED